MKIENETKRKKKMKPKIENEKKDSNERMESAITKIKTEQHDRILSDLL